VRLGQNSSRPTADLRSEICAPASRRGSQLLSHHTRALLTRLLVDPADAPWPPVSHKKSELIRCAAQTVHALDDPREHVGISHGHWQRIIQGIVVPIHF
jgi:hypothetical protein